MPFTLQPPRAKSPSRDIPPKYFLPAPNGSSHSQLETNRFFWSKLESPCQLGLSLYQLLGSESADPPPRISCPSSSDFEKVYELKTLKPPLKRRSKVTAAAL